MTDPARKQNAENGKVPATPSRSFPQRVREGWGRLVGEILYRLGEVVARPKAVLYMFIAVMVVGGLGTLTTFQLYRYQAAGERDLVLSAFTYVVAILATAFADSSVDAAGNPISRLLYGAGALLACVPLADHAFTMILDTSRQPQQVTLARVLLWTAPSWVVWMFANITDRKFGDADDPAAPAGGHPLRDLS